MFFDWTESLRAKLAEPLPGEKAWKRMAPSSRPLQLPSAETLLNAQKSAVLVFLYPHENEPHLVLMKRQEYPGVHSGQISFPGGRVEEYDTSHEDTALRETEEEIGLPRDQIEILGRLDDYIARTNFRITPIVAAVSPPFELKLDPIEVAEAFEVPLSFFLDPTNHQRHLCIEHGKERHVYAMPYQDYYIWGITAGMLFNFYEFLIGKSEVREC